MEEEFTFVITTRQQVSILVKAHRIWPVCGTDVA
jgi:hypothetical protein